MELQDLPEDYLRTLQRGFDCLSRCNILFFDKNTSWFRRVFPLFYQIPITMGFYVSLVAYFVKVFKEAIPFADVVNMTAVLTVSMQVLYRVAVLVSKKEEIRTIVLQLGRIWSSTDLSEEQIMTKKVLLKRLHFRFTVLHKVIMIGAWQYLLLPLFSTLFSKYIQQQDSKLILPFDCVYPFDPTRDWPTYLTIYVLQSYSILVIVYIYCGSEIVLISLTSQLSTMFTLLQYDFENLGSGLMSDCALYAEVNTGQRIENLIRRHQTLLRLAEDLNNIFHGILFINLGSSTLMVTFFLVSTLVLKDGFQKLKNYVAGFSSSYPLFTVCFHGEQIKDASLEIGDSAYRSLWYEGNKNHRRAIFFVIIRSQTPSHLSTAIYNKITLATFMSVMSTTWSYYSLALSMYGE